MSSSSLVTIAAAVGLIGDAILQILVRNGIGNYGLRPYFQQHGTAESLFIAAGMMAVFWALYLACKFPLKWYWVFLYGVVLDIIFRVTKVFPSLDGYYKALSPPVSMFWGGLPMIIPLLIWQFANK